MKMNSKLWLLLALVLVGFGPCKTEEPAANPAQPAAQPTVAAPIPASNPAPAAPQVQAGASLSLQKNTFNPGEAIVVQYVALPSYASNAWIGIIPSSVAHGNESVNDQHDITYKYLRKSTAGAMTFHAPNSSGSYDLRMHDTDNNGVEVASVTFTVSGAAPAVAPTPAASGLKFNVGDAVMVKWKNSWWPAHVIAVRNSGQSYRIHYDGYSNSWDEWVGNARIRGK